MGGKTTIGLINGNLTQALVKAQATSMPSHSWPPFAVLEVNLVVKAAKKRNIESGDYVMMFSDRVAAHKDTIIGVHNDHFQFSELMKRLITLVVITTTRSV